MASPAVQALLPWRLRIVQVLEGPRIQLRPSCIPFFFHPYFFVIPSFYYHPFLSFSTFVILSCATEIQRRSAANGPAFTSSADSSLLRRRCEQRLYQSSISKSQISGRDVTCYVSRTLIHRPAEPNAPTRRTIHRNARRLNQSGNRFASHRCRLSQYHSGVARNSACHRSPSSAHQLPLWLPSR